MAKKERFVTEWAVVKRMNPTTNNCGWVYVCNAAGFTEYDVSTFIDEYVSNNYWLHGPFDYVLNYLHIHTPKDLRGARNFNDLKKHDYYKSVRVFEL